MLVYRYLLYVKNEVCYDLVKSIINYIAFDEICQKSLIKQNFEYTEHCHRSFTC